MSYQDKVLECKGCGAQFTFSVKEQEFYAEKGFVNEPQRCKMCRDRRKQGGGGGGGRGRSGGGGGRSFGGGGRTDDRPKFNATCSTCGVETQVPFKPDPAKPIYCRDCFKKSRSSY